MYLNELKISDFRNIHEADLTFSPGINCFIGNNGAGKTNLLDAVYYLSFCKSYFNFVENQNIMHDAPFFAIHGKYQFDEQTLDLCQCILERGKPKIFKLNKKEYDRLADHIGRYPLVMVSPYDRDLINNGSDVRRRYIDSVISQFDRMYLDDLIVYNKALAQRNALLRRFFETGFFDHSQLEVWNLRMEMPAMRIHNRRKNFIEEFRPVFQNYYQQISESSETVNILYDSKLNTDSFLSLQEKALEKDRMVKYSTAGIHKDDFDFLIENFPIKNFGSQGQQKSFLVSIKLAQFEYIKEKMGNIKPILLLDDIFDKLDQKRVNQLIQLAGSNYFGQVFISDTQQDRIDQIFKDSHVDRKIFKVEKGTVSLIESPII
ncbi:MAG: DNA replication and repair protein RecF [Bacteroidales bacterium]|nr:DNA replication and repair protein RecF [Bacteroidales bacterium]